MMVKVLSKNCALNSKMLKLLLLLKLVLKPLKLLMLMPKLVMRSSWLMSLRMSKRLQRMISIPIKLLMQMESETEFTQKS